MGSMYAGGTDLPFGPAERATLVGLRTHSSPDDSRAHGNELSFADEAGREELRMFAQRDMNVRVQRDGRTVVGNDLFHFVTGNQMGRVGKDRRTLVDGNATEKTAGDWALAVGGKAVIDAAGGLVIDGGGCRLRLGPSGFEVELGSNYIVISADGVRVNGQLVKLNCAGAAPNIGAANVPAPEIPEPPPRAGGK
jgi:type VI secretion system secreted protein VgrG